MIILLLLPYHNHNHYQQSLSTIIITIITIILIITIIIITILEYYLIYVIEGKVNQRKGRSPICCTNRDINNIIRIQSGMDYIVFLLLFFYPRDCTRLDYSILHSRMEGYGLNNKNKDNNYYIYRQIQTYCYPSLHRYPQAALLHLQKIDMGSSADRICIWKKQALWWPHFSQFTSKERRKERRRWRWRWRWRYNNMKRRKHEYLFLLEYRIIMEHFLKREDQTRGLQNR